jgi:hypothetical protein
VAQASGEGELPGVPEVAVQAGASRGGTLGLVNLFIKASHSCLVERDLLHSLRLPAFGWVVNVIVILLLAQSESHCEPLVDPNNMRALRSSSRSGENKQPDSDSTLGQLVV